jgi:hypothetical protein
MLAGLQQQANEDTIAMKDDLILRAIEIDVVIRHPLVSGIDTLAEPKGPTKVAAHPSKPGRLMTPLPSRNAVAWSSSSFMLKLRMEITLPFLSLAIVTWPVGTG